MELLSAMHFIGDHVAIIGRGQAVHGLWDELIDGMDCTVTVCHSHTRQPMTSTVASNVVVWAAPEASSKKYSLCDKKLIIDLTGNLEKSVKSVDPEEFVSASDIGRLTTAILAYRAATWRAEHE